MGFYFHANCSFKAERLGKYGCPGTDKKIRHQTTAEHGPQQHGPDHKAVFQDHGCLAPLVRPAAGLFYNIVINFKGFVKIR